MLEANLGGYCWNVSDSAGGLSIERNGDMKNLGMVLRQWRWASKLSVRDAAKQMGINHSTLCRIEHGKETDSRNTFKVLRWLLS